MLDESVRGFFMRGKTCDADRQVDVSGRRVSCEACYVRVKTRSRARQQLRPLTEGDSDATVSGQGHSWGSNLRLRMSYWLSARPRRLPDAREDLGYVGQLNVMTGHRGRDWRWRHTATMPLADGRSDDRLGARRVSEPGDSPDAPHILTGRRARWNEDDDVEPCHLTGLQSKPWLR